MLIEQWRRHYNTIRPHSSLGYTPPAPAAILPGINVPDYAVPRHHMGAGNHARLSHKRWTTQIWLVIKDINMHAA